MTDAKSSRRSAIGTLHLGVGGPGGADHPDPAKAGRCRVRIPSDKVGKAPGVAANECASGALRPRGVASVECLYGR